MVDIQDADFVVEAEVQKINKASGNDITFGEGTDFILGTTTGTKIGTATTQKIGFYNSTPIVKGTAFTQTYNTATHTHAQSAVSTTGSTTSTPYGYTTSAQADAIPTAINELKQVVNGLIDDLQALGLIA